VDHETCDECGFDGSVYDADALVAAVRALGPAWDALLASAGDELRARPAPEVWSALEYAAHSRDITALHAFGVDYALEHDEASLPGIDGDELIQSAASSYNAEDPQHVADALAGEASKLAALVEGDGGHWDRTLSVGDSSSSVRRMVEHALHDSTHHLRDVERGLAKLRGD
jgi:hypothetical protein